MADDTSVSSAPASSEPTASAPPASTPTPIAAPDRSSPAPASGPNTPVARHPAMPPAYSADDDDVFGDASPPGAPTRPAAGASPPAPTPPALSPQATAPAAPDIPATKAYDEAIEDIAFRTFEPFGYTREDIKALGTGPQRDQALRMMVRAYQDRGGPAPQVPAPQPQPPARPQQQPQAAPDAPPFTLDPTIVDESVIDAFNKLHSHYGGVVQQYGQTIQQLQAALQRFEHERTMDTVESFISELGAEWRDVYGDKPFRDLEPGSPAHLNAMALLREAAGESYKLRMFNPNAQPRVRSLIEKAHAALHGQRIAQRTQSQVVQQIRDSAGRFTAQPNGRHTPAPADEPRGVTAARNRLKELGVEPDEFDD